MRRIAALALLGSSLFATSVTLYQDTKTGALYTKPGPDRVKLGEFISKDEVVATTKDIQKKMSKELGGTRVFSKVPKLKINGLHYLGYRYTHYDDKAKSDVSRFETRRNYFQVKAYWNKKDYARVTMDTYQNDQGSWDFRLKYAYIYLSDILPYTGAVSYTHLTLPTKA